MHTRDPIALVFAVLAGVLVVLGVLAALIGQAIA